MRLLLIQVHYPWGRELGIMMSPDQAFGVKRLILDGHVLPPNLSVASSLDSISSWASGKLEMSVFVSSMWPKPPNTEAFNARSESPYSPPGQLLSVSAKSILQDFKPTVSVKQRLRIPLVKVNDGFVSQLMLALERNCKHGRTVKDKNESTKVLAIAFK